MDEHALHPPQASRRTIDKRDHFMQGLYRVLESPPQGEEDRTKVFLAYDQLVEWSQKLAGQLESFTTSLASSGSRQEDAWKQLYVFYCCVRIFAVLQKCGMGTLCEVRKTQLRAKGQV